MADSSGNANTGTISNATWTSAGKFGDALVFNGTTARVNIPDSASLHLSSGMTLEAWVNPASSSASWRDVIYKGNDNYYLEGSSSGSGAPAGGGTFGGSNGNAFGTAALAANTWAYLALSYDGSTLRIYVNGTLVGSQAKTGAIASSTNQLQIGGDSIFGQFFSGMIDEVRVYNTALTAAQVQTDMTTPVEAAVRPIRNRRAPRERSRRRRRVQPRSTSAGVLRPTTWVSRATGSNGAKALAVRTSSQVGTSTSTSFSDTGLAASTTYSYRVRAADAAKNLGPYSNVATAATQTGSSGPGLVAAYGFEEGSGTSVADSSGNANTGTISNATWTTCGQVRGRARFQRDDRSREHSGFRVLASVERDDARGVGEPGIVVGELA